MHVYELTQHDDKYDLRYRLKDKIYLPSATPSTSPASVSSLPLAARSGLSSLAASRPNQAGESKDDFRHPGSSSSQQSRHRGGGGGRQVGGGGIDGTGGGGSRDRDGGADLGGRGEPPTTAFLLVTWSNVVLCEGRVLQLYDFSGTKVTTVGPLGCVGGRVFWVGR